MGGMAKVEFRSAAVAQAYNVLCDQDEAIEDALEWLRERLGDDPRRVRSRDYSVPGQGVAQMSTAGLSGKDGHVTIVWRLEASSVVIYGVLFDPLG